ncbi:MAG: hypothetical protein LQ343_000506 [Gyalolechia ehrenbergii]|nr:MAG: hypothetical protein LQ343_000506 [Gyalolechia ehrenbergii]
MESPLPPDPYKALDVVKDASLATIRTAHRKLVLKTHPDKVQGDEELKKKRAEDFHQIQQAYEILSDDARRKAYDERVKLATLRAEMTAERGGSRHMPEARPMNGRSPIIEVRGGRVYEERAPRRSYDDHEDDFFNYKPRDTRPRYEDPYDMPPLREPSIRLQEEKRRARDLEEGRERERLRRERGSAKAEKKSVFAERTRQRTKDRKKDYDSKFRGAYVEDGSDTSSDSSDPKGTYQPRQREDIPKYRYEEARRKDREDTPRRTSKCATEDGYSDFLDSKVPSVRDYIRQSREPEPELRRPAMYKGGSMREIHPVPSPPATPKVGGRGQVRRESSPPPKSAAKNRRVTEIVDPPEARRPSLPVTSSDPKGLRGSTSSSHKGKPPRAFTLDHQTVQARQPGIRRAETMPINRSRPDAHHASKSSRSKEIDPGYSIPEDHPGPSPKFRSTIFVVEEDEGVSRGYDTVYVTPEGKGRRERDLSPKGRKSSDRPPLLGRGGSSARLPPSRSTSYAPDADDFRAPRLKRAETAYASPSTSRQAPNQSPTQYFGEISQTEEPYKVVYQRPKIGPQDIRYGKHERRSSEDNRDWAPGSEFDSRNRPSYGRSASRVY